MIKHKVNSFGIDYNVTINYKYFNNKIVDKWIEHISPMPNNAIVSQDIAFKISTDEMINSLCFEDLNNDTYGGLF